MELMPENVLPMHHTFSCERKRWLFSVAFRPPDWRAGRLNRRFCCRLPAAPAPPYWPPPPPSRRIKQNKITEKNEPLQDPSASPQLKRIRRDNSQVKRSPSSNKSIILFINFLVNHPADRSVCWIGGSIDLAF